MNDIRTGTCPLCAHEEIVETVPLEFSGEFNTERTMHAVWGKKTTKSWLEGEREVLDKDKPYGKLTLSFCRACGFAQWFVEDPGKVPNGRETGTRLVGRRKAPPYR